MTEVARGQHTVQDLGSEFSPEQKAAMNPKSCDGAEVVVQSQIVDDPKLESGLDSKAGRQRYDGTEVGPSKPAERKKPHTGRVQPSVSEPSANFCMCDLELICGRQDSDPKSEPGEIACPTEVSLLAL